MSHAASSAAATAQRVFRIRAVTLVALLLLWEAFARSGLVFSGVAPPLLEILSAIAAELADPSFYRDLGITALEAVAGFSIGSAIAVVVGVALGLNSYGRAMLEPYIVAIAGTPKIIFLPILFLVFGLGIESKIAKAAISAFFPVVLNCTAGIAEIPPVLIRVGKGFGLSARQMLQKVYIPAIAAPLATGLRLGIAMAVIGVLAAEITYSNGGLGYRLIHDADQFRIPSVYAITVLIFAISAAVNFAFTKVEELASRSKDRARGDFGALMVRTEAAR